MYPATLAAVSNVLYPPPLPVHTRVIALVASKVELSITGHTARAWHLYALLIEFLHCQKPGLKAVPPTFYFWLRYTDQSIKLC